MKNSKLGRILDQLTKKEVQVIGASLLSPLLDGKQYHVDLFQ